MPFALIPKWQYFAEFTRILGKRNFSNLFIPSIYQKTLHIIISAFTTLVFTFFFVHSIKSLLSYQTFNTFYFMHLFLLFRLTGTFTWFVNSSSDRYAHGLAECSVHLLYSSAPQWNCCKIALFIQYWQLYGEASF